MIKVVSLAIGLTVGLVLIARVELNRNYDRCIADKERVYQVGEMFQKMGEEAAEYENTPGGAIPAMCRYIPEIEVGTRWTYQFTDEKLTTEDGTHHDFEHTVFADLLLRYLQHKDTAGRCQDDSEYSWSMSD